MVALSTRARARARGPMPCAVEVDGAGESFRGVVVVVSGSSSGCAVVWPVYLSLSV